MTLSEKDYSIKMGKIYRLSWDLYKFRMDQQSRTTIPNPYCEDLIDKAYESMKELLIQLKQHNIDYKGDSLNNMVRWWYPDIEKESKEKTQLVENGDGGDLPT